MEKTLLNATGIRQGYGRTTILEDFSFNAGPGLVGLLGPNGAGKTTVLKTLATAAAPRAGSLTVSGVEILDENSLRAARKSIGYLPQDFGYPRNFTVLDFVKYCSWLRGVNSPSKALCMEAIDKTGLASRANSKMKTLSGGMLQRAGIAGAIVGSPQVLLLDEPTVGLDPAQRLQFRSLLRSLEASAVVLSTHLIEDVAAVCDRVVVLDQGHVRFSGSTDQLASRATATAPGNTALERGYMSVLTDSTRGAA